MNMFCQECGKEVNDKAAVCVHCGVAMSNQSQTTSNVTDTGDEWYYSTGWMVFWILMFWPIAVYGYLQRKKD